MQTTTRLNPTNSRWRFRVRPETQRLIARQNLSQNLLARKCRVSSGYMSQLLTGKRCPGPEVRERLLAVLRVLPFDAVFEEVPAGQRPDGAWGER